ncbi:hypothetical protein VDG1235_3660 [Verrucomicrobiia bacterium DG1235]|nr:hypothetical protein VDG1235_3660 [Verrucomicrobiae bacterium DG1235]
MIQLLKRTLTLAVAALTCSAAFADEEVLHIDLDLFLDFNYDVDGFNVKEYIEDRDWYTYTDTEFEDDYPIFDGAADYDVYGFGSFEYDFYNFDVGPTFDLNEKYDWEIWIESEAGFIADVDTGSGIEEYDGYDYFYDEFEVEETSVSDVTGIIGLTPEDLVAEIVAFFSPLPGSGTLADLLTALSLPTTLPLVSINPTTIEYDTSFEMPFGYVDVALHEPFVIPTTPVSPPTSIDYLLQSLAYVNAGADVDIHIRAVRQVPDSGTTGILGLLGFTLLIAAKRRFQN